MSRNTPFAILFTKMVAFVAFRLT